MKDENESGAEIIQMPARYVGSIAPVVGQIVFMPLTMMVYGLNLLARAARGVPMPASEQQPLRPGAMQEPNAMPPDIGRDSAGASASGRAVRRLVVASARLEASGT